jgi:exopolysaccharide production protein ExoZ
LNMLLWPMPDRLLLVSWTLSHEILFYIVFAIGILVPRRIWLFVVALWLSCILVVSIAGVTVSRELDVVTSSRNLGFFLGCAVGWLILDDHVFAPKIILWCGLVLAVISLFGYMVFDNHSAIHRLSFALCGSLIIYGGSCVEKRYSVKVPSVLMKLGDASYSLYLVHVGVLSIGFSVAVRLHLSHSAYAQVAIGTVLALVAGFLVHWVLEKPLLRVLQTRLQVAGSGPKSSRST